MGASSRPYGNTAGRSPLGTRGERPGSRDNPIHYFQEVRDQAGAIRQFAKWDFNLELPGQIGYALQRGARLMQTATVRICFPFLRACSSPRNGVAPLS